MLLKTWGASRVRLEAIGASKNQEATNRGKRLSFVPKARTKSPIKNNGRFIEYKRL